MSLQPPTPAITNNPTQNRFRILKNQFPIGNQPRQRHKHNSSHRSLKASPDDLTEAPRFYLLIQQSLTPLESQLV